MPGLPATKVQGNCMAASSRLSRSGLRIRVCGKGGRVNFVTAGLVPIIYASLSNQAPNHPGEGDDVPGGTDHNV